MAVDMDPTRRAQRSSRAAQAAVGRTNFRRTFLSPELMVSTLLYARGRGDLQHTHGYMAATSHSVPKRQHRY